MEVFQEENWLQIADHVATIVFGALALILTIIVIHLEIRDKSKRIAIKELQTQTKELRNLYMLSIQPRFIRTTVGRESVIKNIGGDAFDIEVSPNFSINSFPKYLSSKSHSKYSINNTGAKHCFTFKDCLGNKYSQTFDVSRGLFSNLEQIESTEES